jgi:hypothetical protein
VQSLLPALFWQPPAEGMRMKSCLLQPPGVARDNKVATKAGLFSRCFLVGEVRIRSPLPLVCVWV